MDKGPYRNKAIVPKEPEPEMELIHKNPWWRFPPKIKYKTELDKTYFFRWIKKWKFWETGYASIRSGYVYYTTNGKWVAIAKQYSHGRQIWYGDTIEELLKKIKKDAPDRGDFDWVLGAVTIASKKMNIAAMRQEL